MADLTDYTGLITSEHNQRPKFMAVVVALAQPMVDVMNVLASMPGKFDLDKAVGAQLDDVGRWVGISRSIRTPLTDIYFSLDVEGLGFDQGIWKGPFDPDTGLTTLDDDTYRLVIKAKIGANHWDGTMEGSVSILNSIFSPTGELEPKSVHANAEPFGVGDGSRFQYQLLYQGHPVYKVDSATLFRNDWQGNQRLYPTQRTNALRYSQDFSQSVWTKSRVVVTPATVAAPDGKMTATKLVPSADNNNHAFAQNATTITGAVQCTWSVYAKAAEYNALRLRLADSTGFLADVIVDLSNGTIRNPNAASRVEPVGDGWYRVVMTWATNSGSTFAQSGVWVYDNNFSPTFSGDGSSGIYVWGAQLEVGSVATPYIPTESTAVTITDYTLSPTGIVELGQTPTAGATLTWTGDGYTYPSGTYVFIQDNQDMTMTIGIAGTVPSAVFLALLKNGYIPLKPEGVRVNFTIVTTVGGLPLFGFDANNPYVAGFDVGAWGRLL